MSTNVRGCEVASPRYRAMVCRTTKIRHGILNLDHAATDIRVRFARCLAKRGIVYYIDGLFGMNSARTQASMATRLQDPSVHSIGHLFPAWQTLVMFLFALVAMSPPALAKETVTQSAPSARATSASASATSQRPRVKRAPALALRSGTALVVDEITGKALYEKNGMQPVPIASITKLMTAMVILDSQLPLTERITITKDDRDRLRGSRSRLHYGANLSRGELLQLALMASENRAAAALARTYPGGMPAFVTAMNQKARELGMTNTQFADSSGLSSGNVSSARDLARLVQAAARYPVIREYSTATSQLVKLPRYAAPLRFINTNGLVNNSKWDIDLSKTGYTSEAGRCLVMKAKLAGRPVIIILMDSWGKNSRIGDANRVRKWLEAHAAATLRVAG